MTFPIIIGGSNTLDLASYDIENAGLFNSDTSSISGYTPSSPSTTTATISYWVQRSKITNTQNTFCSGSGGTYSNHNLNADDTLWVWSESGGYAYSHTNAKLRDTASWMHVVVQYNTTHGAQSERCKIWFNGVLQTLQADTWTASYDIRLSNIHFWGHNSVLGYEFNGYLAEIYYFDNQTLTPDDFAEFDLTTGKWKAKAFEGTYGANDYHLNFSNASALGNDASVSDTVTTSTSSAQWTGATGDYTFANGTVNTSTNDRAIKSVDTFTGDFRFTSIMDASLGAVFGFYDITEDATFNQNNASGGMAAMTNSWYYGTATGNNKAYYGSALQFTGSYAVGDRLTYERVGSTIKVYINDILVHTYSQTSTAELRLVIACSFGSVGVDMSGVAWTETVADKFGNNFSTITNIDQITSTPTNVYCRGEVVYPTRSTKWTEGSTKYLDATGTQAGCGNMTFDIEGSTLYQFGFKTITSSEYFGVVSKEALDSQDLEDSSNSGGFDLFGGPAYGMLGNNGNLLTPTTQLAYGTSYTSANDMECVFGYGAVWFLKDGTPQGGATINEIEAGNTTNAAVTGLTGQWTMFGGGYSGSAVYMYTDPAQFTFTTITDAKLLCTDNLPTPTIADPREGFASGTYTGTGSSLDITPDVVDWNLLTTDWMIRIKPVTSGHWVYIDTVRGTTLYKEGPNVESVEGTDAQMITSVSATQITLGTSSRTNTSGTEYVYEIFRVGQTYGFDIVTYTGNGATTQNVNHNLGVKPDYMIVTMRDSAAAWYMWHKDLTNQTTYAILFSRTAGESNVGPSWNSTAPTSTQFSLGNDTNVNASSGAGIAYVFANVEGFSWTGVVDGNSSADGWFANSMFNPSSHTIKALNATNDWYHRLDIQQPYNPITRHFYLQTNSAELTTAGYEVDVVSNGLKCRNASNSHNNSAYKYLVFLHGGTPLAGGSQSEGTAR